jgi:spore germination protein KC
MRTTNANKVILAVLVAAALLTSGGCGNRVEINERNLVLAAAIDKPLAPEKKNESDTQQGKMSGGQGGASGQGQTSKGYKRIPPPPKDQTPRYTMSIEAPVVRNLGGGTGGGGGGGGGKSNVHWILAATGNTMWDIERALSIRAGRQDFYGHMKVIVIGEEVAREDLHPVLDFFVRRREIQQRINIVIANGQGRQILNITPVEENFVAFYLDRMLGALFRTGAKINTDLLEVRRSLQESGNAVLPRIRASSPTEVVAGGAAVVKDWKLAGWLSELETSGYNIVQGRLIGGSITVVDPKSKSGLMTMIVRSSKAEKSVEFVNHNPVFTVNITSDWDVVEKGSTTSLWDQNTLKMIQNRLQKEVQRRALNVVDKMQREFKADIFGFGGMLNHKYPDYWRTVKQDWDERYFPNVKVNVKASVKIRRTESET